MYSGRLSGFIFLCVAIKHFIIKIIVIYIYDKLLYVIILFFIYIVIFRHSKMEIGLSIQLQMNKK